MKILQVINNLGSGGAEKLVNDLSTNMKKKGIDIEVALLQENGSIYINDLERNGIKVHKLSENSMYSLKTLFKLFKIIKMKEYSIIHAHIFPTFYFVGIISLFYKKAKYIYTEHNTGNRRRKYRILKIIEKFIYSRYEKVICISDKTESNLRKHINNFSKKIVVIFNGIELEKYATSIQMNRKNIDSKIKVEDKIITMVGRFSKQKDQKTLIKAMNFLPEEYKLLLIGEGELKEETIKFTEKLNLKNRVFFLGVRKDVPDILKTSDLVVLSSNWEGFGIAALEGMASGIPTIISNVDGMREMVKDGGVFFNCGEEKELVQRINELFLDENYYNEIAKKGLERSKLFSLDSMVSKYLEIYEEVGV